MTSAAQSRVIPRYERHDGRTASWRRRRRQQLRVADFHELRTTFGTNLARSGVALSLAQRLMRHSTPVLTANVYTVLTPEDYRGAIERLPKLSAPAGAVPAGQAAEEALPTCGQTCRDSRKSRLRSETSGDTAARRAREKRVAVEPAENLALEAAGVPSGGGSGDWTRTSDLRIMRPPL